MSTSSHPKSILVLMGALVGGLPAMLLAQEQPVSASAVAGTPASRQFDAWLEAFNSSDAAELGEFLSREAPDLEGPPVANAGLRGVTGGFRLVRVEEARDERIVVLLEERDWEGIYARLTIDVEPQPDGKIKAMQLVRVAAPPGLPPVPRMSEVEALAALKEKLEMIAGTGGPFAFSGAVRVARGGDAVLDFASGQADREQGIANTIDTRFRIGSMNKMMTAVAILQLVQAQKIRLDAPIGSYLPDYPNRDLASRVNVRHLLTHTGGTGDIFGPQFMEHREQLCEHSDYVALYGDRELAFVPGERFAYSNYGFLLLGAIVEAVTGQSYYEYVDEHIFRPAGMTATGSLPEAVEVPRRSIGYTVFGAAGPRELGPNTDTLPCRGTAAGGGYATVADLTRFAHALTEGLILEEELLAEATRNQVAEAHYGYGFVEQEVNGTRAFGHSGGAPGMSAEMKVFPELGYSVAVAANMDTGWVSRIIHFVGARLPKSQKSS